MKLASLTTALLRAFVEIRPGNGRTPSHARGERGSALVEFALVLPVLLLFITSVVAMVFTFNQALEFQNAVTIGAQVLSISRGNTDNPCLIAENAIESAAPNLTNTDFTLEFVFTSFSTSGGTSTSPISGANASSSTACAAAMADMVQGDAVTVYATYPCINPLAVYGGGAYSNGTSTGALNFNCSLSSEVTEIIQ